ncbi:uncharacterized protein LOC120836930 [Ixodes scapularis]|uniref:uncharacterized protein LOC120836930 n=1 Tax=Ixodes scapularis TaxID=6945 RepID=UPI001A9F5719|nr:uncharacterized protein LOC120836930 [Ixodes scapularis]
MAHTLPPFPSFNVQATDANNIGLEWAKWVDRFENFLVAYNITSDVRKKALLLHYAGEEVHDLYRSLPDDSSSATVSSTAQGAARTSTSEYDAARAKLDAHFAPRINPTFAIYRFRQAQQNVGESLDAFYARLRQLSRHCNFPDVDLEVKNQIIIATTSTRLRKYAILHSLDLPDILKQGRMFEDVEHDVSKIERSADKPVLAVRKDEQHRGSKPKRSLKPPQRPNYQAQHHSLSTDCHNCGGKWPHGGGRSNCPAWGKTCKACNKIGHFAKVCRSSNKTVQTISQTRQDSSSSGEEHVFVAKTLPPASTSPKAVIRVDNVPITFVIDTGATVSVVGEDELRNCHLDEKLEKTSVKVFPYKATSPLQLLGKVSVSMMYKERHPVPQRETGTRIAKVPDEYVNFIQRQCIPKAFSVEEVVEQTKADQQLQLLVSSLEGHALSFQLVSRNVQCNSHTEVTRES